MTKLPLLLRREGDPLDELAPVLDEWEAIGDQAVEPYVGRRRTPDSPLLVIGAAALDGYFAAEGAVELMGDGELVEAVTRAGLHDFPFGTAEGERLRGALTALRGAVGEQWVLDHLTSGALASPVGASAAELMTFTHPGTDVVFTGDDGHVVATANVKIASSARVILDHFAAHPDVPIVYASSDAAADAARHGLQVLTMTDAAGGHGHVVVDIGRSSVDFDHDVTSLLPETYGLDDVAFVAEFLDNIPWFSMGAIAVRAIQRLQAGEARAAVLRDAGRDATVASVGATAAHAAASVASSELSVALVALTASSLTYAVTEVRRSWVDASVGLRQAAELAEQIADRFDPPPPRDRTSWREKLRRLAATHR
ncbi:MAG: hypothetical protein H6513_03355 [Acidimicrobiaceae bacterium]|nr:hypothetical protein [Acidimicrobiaceae bacterium]